MSRVRVVFSIGGMHGGGSERQIVSILNNIDRSRIEPLLYLVYRTGPLLHEIPPDVPVTSFEERFGPPRGPGILMNRKRIADMQRFLRECHADVSYDRTFLMTMIAAAAAQQAGIPNISTIVTGLPVGFHQVAGRFQWAKRKILQKLYSRSTHVISNSEGAARAAEKFYGLTPGIVQVYPNGIDLEKIRQIANAPVADPWWNGPPQRQRLFRIVTAGRLANQTKGFDLLVEAVNRIRKHAPSIETRLAILGEGPDRGILQNQIDTLNLNNHIQLTGFRTDAPAWFRSADLFVLPSLVEGMPNVIAEAMACGTPVLAADCESGPREMLGDGQFGALCGVGSITSLVTGIRRFLADEPLAKRYTSAATEHVEREYSIESATRRLEDLFESAAKSGRAG